MSIVKDQIFFMLGTWGQVRYAENWGMILTVKVSQKLTIQDLIQNGFLTLAG